PRRTARGWAVDLSRFLLAVVIGLAAARSLPDETGLPPFVVVVDLVLGALSCAALRLRRRWPVGLAVATVPVGLLSDTAGGACRRADGNSHRRPVNSRCVGAVSSLLTDGRYALLPLSYWLRPDPELPSAAVVAFTALLMLTLIGWGMFVRSERQLLLSLRDRARRAETEARLRAEQAQRLAREAIARGLPNAPVATELLMSVATVKTHVSRILARLGLNDRVQTALLVHDAGLFDEDGH
ncbi:response regulator transcription factor, partial [Streptomyces collinus]